MYIYKAETLTLSHIFNLKQDIYDTIDIDHKTLQDCLDLGTLYLDHFFFIFRFTLKRFTLNLKRRFSKFRSNKSFN